MTVEAVAVREYPPGSAVLGAALQGSGTGTAVHATVGRPAGGEVTFSMCRQIAGAGSDAQSWSQVWSQGTYHCLHP